MDVLEKPVLTAKEVASILCISRSHAYQAIRKGSIPSFKIEGRVCIPTHAIRQMIGLDDTKGELCEGRR